MCVVTAVTAVTAVPVVRGFPRMGWHFPVVVDNLAPGHLLGSRWGKRVSRTSVAVGAVQSSVGCANT